MAQTRTRQPFPRTRPSSCSVDRLRTRPSHMPARRRRQIQADSAKQIKLVGYRSGRLGERVSLASVPGERCVADDKKAGPVGPAMGKRRDLLLLPRACSWRRLIARSLTMPGDVRRMPVRPLMDISSGRDAKRREKENAARKAPSSVGVGRDVAVSVFHGVNIY